MSFYQDVIRRDKRFKSTEQIRDIALLEPVTRAAIMAIIADAKAVGTELIVTETYRSADRQAVVYAQGLSKLRSVGAHHFGLACDLCIIENKRADFTGKKYDFLGPLARAHGLVWGGSWKQQDKVHFQRISVADQPQLFCGAWYPDAKYRPA